MTGDGIAQISTAIPRCLEERVAPVVFTKATIAKILLRTSAIERLVNGESLKTHIDIANEADRTMPFSFHTVTIHLDERTATDIIVEATLQVIEDNANIRMTRYGLVYELILITILKGIVIEMSVDTQLEPLRKA